MATTIQKPSASSSSTTTTTTTFPASVFRALTPAAYLHAHLTHSPPIRPSTRAPSDFRPPVLNTNSLSHSAGSAVVRTGDTAVVVGVRPEIVGVKDIPGHAEILKASQESAGEAQDDRVEKLGLVVPNVELATGCAGSQIPGTAPTRAAQRLAWRVREGLVGGGVVDVEDLEIMWDRPVIGDEESSEEEEEDGAMEMEEENKKVKTRGEVVGYFVLYVDILVISLAGTPFDSIWAATLAALRTTVLPKAVYDPELEMVVCSPLKEEARRLNVKGMPIACTFRVFEPSRFKGLKDEKKTWLLADPDEMEEELCSEEISAVVDCSNAKLGTQIRKLEKTGGWVMGAEEMEQVIESSEKRWAEWNGLLEEL
ncbi:hypothetical protein BT63DRAFT_479011 [Microthyrium microscopicum]|uniref:Uncharacterized protein n=1 Tax=Microthyrium microscopicum TaxID=703497 RepID=A0A6A6UCG3_9PEZI|nr:hypothetical protein BT63DRAFT_479011 [Microthyrium microscopicum]